MAVFIVLFGAFSYALAEIIYSYLCNNRFKNPLVLTFYASITNFMFLPLILVWGTPTTPPVSVIIGYIGLGIISIWVQIPSYLAFRKNDASVVNCLWTLGKVILPAAAFLFLGERLSFAQYIGFFLIIFSNIFLNFDTSQKSKLNLAFFLMLGCSLLNTGSGVIEKYILNKDDNWINIVVYVNLISTAMTCMICLNTDLRKEIFTYGKVFKQSCKYLLGAEFLCFIGHCCGIYALSKLPLVIKSALASTESTFILLISIFMIKIFKIRLREKIGIRDILKKIICFMLVISGIVLTVK